MSRYKQPYTLFKRGKYWYYRTYTEDGIRTVAKTTGKTSKNAAKDYCEKLYLEGNLAYVKILFSEYTKGFFDDDSPFVKDRAKALSKNTLQSYRTKYKNYLLPYFGKKEIQDINYTMLKKFRIEMLEKYSAHTTSSTMNVLAILIKSAYRDRIIKQNPFDFLERFSIEENKKDAFTLNEIKEIYSEINDPDFENLFLLLVLTGMRISEAVGMTSEEVIENDGLIYLNIYRQWNIGEYIPCKFNSKRQLPIIPEIKELLNFPVKRLSMFYACFTPLKAKYEIENVRSLSFHSLRHFFITNSKSFGIPESKIEYCAGHRKKDIKGIYTNYKADDVKEIRDWQRVIYDQFHQDSQL